MSDEDDRELIGFALKHKYIYKMADEDQKGEL